MLLLAIRLPAVPPAVRFEPEPAVAEPAYLQVTAVEVAEHREQLRPGPPHRHNIQWYTRVIYLALMLAVE